MGLIYEQTIKDKSLPTVQVFGIPAPSTTQGYALGTLLFDENTGTHYKYVKATGSIAANENTSYADATGYVVGQAPATAAGVGARAGVAPQAFTTGQYGFIAVHGPVTVNASGTGYVLGDPVAPDVATAGKVIEHTVTGGGATVAEVTRAAAIMGFALQAESGGTVKIFLNRCL